MNVASLELCKELYELSGWDAGATTAWYCWIEAHQDYDVDNGKPSFPAYDLGYLLRKLPRYQRPHVLKLISQGVGNEYDKWACGYHTMFLADTPEDAAVKLAIELFSQGILTRVGDES